MKNKITRNTFTAEERNNAIKLGYCEAYYLLKAYDRIGYNSGVYGWNYDAFRINGKVITTGYRRMIGKRPAVSVEPYENAAKELYRDLSISYDDVIKGIDELMKTWLDACKKASQEA